MPTTAALELSTAATVEPVTVEEVKDWLRIDSDDEVDTLRSLIKAARQKCETYTRRQFITATYKYYLDDFPSDATDILVLPRPPLQSINSITYVDTAGDTQTWSSDEYSADTKTEPGRVKLGYTYVWPASRNQRHAVTVTYVAGYGDSASFVPESIKTAVKFWVAHWYENRELVQTGTTVTPMPMTVEAILQPERVFEFV